jgi:hypothetical protein
MTYDLVRLLNEGAISIYDPEEFSEELKDHILLMIDTAW